MLKQLGIVAISIVYCSLVMNFVHADPGELREKNTTVTAPVKVSLEEKEEILATVDTVYTPYGEFKRIFSSVSVDPSQIAYSEEDANSNTKELILDYGIFYKKEEKNSILK